MTNQPARVDSMRRSATLLPLALAAVTLVGCKFDVSVASPSPGGGIGWRCSSDADCLANYFCDFGIANEGSGDVGACVSSLVDEERCFDNDRDGAFAGNCPDTPAAALDCDDADPTRRPGAEEVCDGIDNNCNCTADTNGDGTLCDAGTLTLAADDGVDEGLPLRPCNKQLGVCAGTSIACLGGTYPDCGAPGVNVYPPEYELVEASCDNLDNDCDGTIDPEAACPCDPDVTEAISCGNDTGTCTRGIQICNEDASLTSCIEASVGRVCEGDGVTPCETNRDCFDGSTCIPQGCETSDDCGANGFCVEELVTPAEDIFDTCTPASAGGGRCPRSVCRFLDEDVTCGDDSECDADAGEVCLSGFCQRPNVQAVTEVCNGLDDDCDGRLDNDSTRADICGNCPYNMILTPLLAQPGAPAFICADAYEASRPDADADDGGQIEFYAVSQPGVRPWNGVSPEDAENACAGTEYQTLIGTATRPVAPKRLCLSVWYQQACGGVANSGAFRPYPYSEPSPTINTDLYEAGTCIDGTLGLSGPALTGSAPECCISPRTEAPDAVTCDMVGNLAEWVKPAGGVAVLAGGSYLDTDARVLSCGDGLNYVADPGPDDYADLTEVGFRCCTLPAP